LLFTKKLGCRLPPFYNGFFLPHFLFFAYQKTGLEAHIILQRFFSCSFSFFSLQKNRAGGSQHSTIFSCGCRTASSGVCVCVWVGGCPLWCSSLLVGLFKSLY
jgi:hypothetical protein